MSSSASNKNDEEVVEHRSLQELIEKSTPEPRESRKPDVESIPTIPWAFGHHFLPPASDPRSDSINIFPCLHSQPCHQQQETPLLRCDCCWAVSSSDITQELENHVFNARAVLRLYNADFPNPEEYKVLRPVRWRGFAAYQRLAIWGGDKKLVQKLLGLTEEVHWARTRSQKRRAERAVKEAEWRAEAKGYCAVSGYASKDQMMAAEEELLEELLNGPQQAVFEGWYPTPWGPWYYGADGSIVQHSHSRCEYTGGLPG